MKILMLAPQPFFVERGTPIAVRFAAESLARQGHQVDLLTFHEGAACDMPGVRHLRISRPPGIVGVPIGFSGKKLVCDLWLAVAGWRLRGEDYDVVHAVEEAVFIALALRPFTRARVVYDVDSIMSDQIADSLPSIAPVAGALVRAAETWAFRRSDLILAVCPSIAERARTAAPSAAVHVLPDIALEPDAQTAATERLRDNVADMRPILLYVGNLEGYQGFDLLIEAQAMIDPAARATLVAIGGTPDAIERYRRMIDDLGLRDDVLLLGPRPIAHLHHYLAQADILCSPRRGGINTPMKIFSYMSAGRAILATDIDSHRQVLDEDTALLVPPSAESLAAGLSALARDPSLRARLGDAAAERAAAEFSLARFEQRLAHAYRDLPRRDRSVRTRSFERRTPAPMSATHAMDERP